MSEKWKWGNAGWYRIDAQGNSLEWSQKHAQQQEVAPTYEESVTVAGDELDRIKRAMDDVIDASAPAYHYVSSREYLALLDQTWAAGQEFGKAVLRHSDSKVIESYRECEVGKRGYFEKNPSPNHGIPSDLDGNFLVACRAEIWEAGRGDKPPTQFEPAPDIDY
jgi:hypothetical protein